MTLQIIGPGFGRTGTTSLKVALEHLGYGPAHHMFEVRDHPELLPSWAAVGHGGRPDWDAIFSGYRAQVDWPGARYWRELAALYPDAKLILTVRDPEEWYDSVAASILPFMAGRGTYDDAHTNAVADMAYNVVVAGVFNERLNERDYAISLFNAHIAEVQRSIPPSRLLTFDVNEGWEPLCAFLDCPVPAISFPRLNSSKQFGKEEWRVEA
jgi:hypothetical protein